MQIIVQGLLTEYKDEGSGEALLLLHGWGDSLHTFDSLVPLLDVNKRRVIRLDLPGFGKSERPKNAWELDDYIHFVQDFLEKIDVPNIAMIIGHSFGGRIAIKGLSSHNLKTDRLILIGAAGITPKKTFRDFGAKAVAKVGNVLTLLPPLYFWRKSLRRWFYRLLGSDYESAGPLKDTFVNIVGEDLKEAALRISVPTLLIWGGNDSATPVSDGKKFAEIIPVSSFEVIPAAGHFIHQEKPRVVAELIKKFHD